MMDKYHPEEAKFEDIYDFDEFVVKSKVPSRPKGTYTLDDKGEPLRPLNRPKIDETNVRFPPIIIGTKQKGGSVLRPAASTSQVPGLAPIKPSRGPSYETKGKLTDQARAQQYVYVTEKRAQSLDMRAKTEKGTGLQMPVPGRSYQAPLNNEQERKSSTDIRAPNPFYGRTPSLGDCRKGLRAPTPIPSLSATLSNSGKDICAPSPIHKRLATSGIADNDELNRGDVAVNGHKKLKAAIDPKAPMPPTNAINSKSYNADPAVVGHIRSTADFDFRKQAILSAMAVDSKSQMDTIDAIDKNKRMAAIDNEAHMVSIAAVNQYKNRAKAEHQLYLDTVDAIDKSKHTSTSNSKAPKSITDVVNHIKNRANTDSKAYIDAITVIDNNMRYNDFTSKAHRTSRTPLTDALNQKYIDDRMHRASVSMAQSKGYVPITTATVDQSYTESRQQVVSLPPINNTKNLTAVNQTEASKAYEYEKEFEELMKAPFDPSKDPRILAYEERNNSRPPRYTSTVRLDLSNSNSYRTLSTELTKNEKLDLEHNFQPTPPVAPRPPSGAPQTGYRRKQYITPNQTISVNALPGIAQNENEAETRSKMVDMPKSIQKQMNRYFKS